MQFHIPQMIINQLDCLLYEEFYLKYPEYSVRLRWEMFRNKGYSCVVCGLTGTHTVLWKDHPEAKGIHADLVCYTDDGMVMMTIDHIIPKSKGGTDSLDNFQPMCYPCNHAKADLDLTHEEIIHRHQSFVEQKKKRDAAKRNRKS